jgi:hypothetical protein
MGQLAPAEGRAHDAIVGRSRHAGHGAKGVAKPALVQCADVIGQLVSELLT